MGKEYQVYVVNKDGLSEVWLHAGQAFEQENDGEIEIVLELKEYIVSIGGKILLSNRQADQMPAMQQVLPIQKRHTGPKLVSG